MTVGIIPAAGQATRMHGLPKYLLPVEDSYLLNVMVKRMNAPCYIGANPSNELLIKRYTDETVYCVESQSMPQTVWGARKFARNDDVLLGMPDTYWTDTQVFDNLLDGLNYHFCVVALFKVTIAQSLRLGMCAWNGNALLEIEDKPIHTVKTRAWGAISWRASFWPYIRQDDPHMGFALQRAIEDGSGIGIYLAEGPYYDCGYPSEYFRLIKEQT